MDKYDIRRPVPQSIEDFPKAKVSNTWSVPEQFDLHSLPLRKSEAQLESMVLAIWHEYMLHDEIISAIQLLENAPYRVRHNVKIEQALSMSRATIEWMDDPIRAEYANTAADPNGMPTDIECGAPLSAEMGNGQHKNRFDWVMSRLPEEFGDLLDLGCQDGTMTNRYVSKCRNVVGVDMNVNNLRIARSAAQAHGLHSTFVNSYFTNLDQHLPLHSFDTVSCTDVYEHLKDPVTDLLIPAKKMVRANGRMLLVTPNGSWLRGDFLPWAHPWLWCESHGSWLAEENRAHLIAPTIWTVAAAFKKAGWWVRDVMTMEHNPSDTPGQSSICVEASATPPANYPGLKVIILDIIDTDETFNHALYVARDFAKIGHSVDFYSPRCRDSISEYVNMIPLEKLQKRPQTVDVYLAGDCEYNQYITATYHSQELHTVNQPASHVLKR